MRRGLAAAVAAVVAGALAGASCAIRMPGKSHTGALSALTDTEAARVPVLARHIDTLAVQIGERNVDDAPAGLAAAEAYVTAELEALGFAVTREAYTVQGVEVANLIADRPGNDEIVVVGAHYDSAPGTPGADDNASGVAALLALAAELPDRPTRTIRLVAFTNEEPPWFHGDDMGSRHTARNAAARGDDIRAMLSLETLAFYSDAPGSQHYPQPFAAFYPDQGNFVAFVGNTRSTRLVRRVTGTFRAHAAFPSEGAALPASIQGVGWSDHRSFWEQGYPAVMVTDTAPNRNPHYHEPTDLPDTLDVAALSRVVTGLVAVVADLASGD